MLLFQVLLVLAGLSALLASAFWVRVAASRSLHKASKLDGTERLFERANRRAMTGAMVTSGLTVLLAAAAFFAGRAAEVF